MLSCGKDWQPRLVDRVIETFGTSTRVSKVSTDAGICFLKGIGNPAGNESLAMELVGSELACKIGLRVPPFAIVDAIGISIIHDGIRLIQDGPAFVSKSIDAITFSSQADIIEKIENKHHIPLLVAFDTWIRNADRCPPFGAMDETPNYDNIILSQIRRKLSMMIIDHTHCFVETDLSSELDGDDFVTDDRVFGAFPSFRATLTEDALRQAARAIARVDEEVVNTIIQSIPNEWGPTGRVRERWAGLILARASRIEDYLIRGLVGQRNLTV